jgi:protocatechuate 3,4-dioxygenase alpha subunit
LIVSELTPSQTVGPFFTVALPRPADDTVTAGTAHPRAILVGGVITDGSGAPVADALVETWQADPAGHYHHPDDRRHESTEAPFHGLARVATGPDGRFAIRTVKPGPVPGPDGRPQAPHLAVGLLARGLLERLVTRIYFDDEPANATDPILALVPAARRGTLIARTVAPGQFRIDFVLQGDGETVFFDV